MVDSDDTKVQFNIENTVTCPPKPRTQAELENEFLVREGYGEKLGNGNMKKITDFVINLADKAEDIPSFLLENKEFEPAILISLDQQ